MTDSQQVKRRTFALSYFSEEEMEGERIWGRGSFGELGEVKEGKLTGVYGLRPESTLNKRGK